MNASELKFQVVNANSNSHFFDRKTMRFFGDTMRNYGVRSAEDNWELYRKHAVKHGLHNSVYFDKETFKQVNDPSG